MFSCALSYGNYELCTPVMLCHLQLCAIVRSLYFQTRSLVPQEIKLFPLIFKNPFFRATSPDFFPKNGHPQQNYRKQTLGITIPHHKQRHFRTWPNLAQRQKTSLHLHIISPHPNISRTGSSRVFRPCRIPHTSSTFSTPYATYRRIF